MKFVFIGTLGALVLLSGVAWLIEPAPPDPSKIPLVWVCDPNPARREQIGLFNKLYPKYHMTLDPSNVNMEKVIVQSLAGVGPDVFSSYNGFQLSAFVRSGVAWDVTDELAEMGIDWEKQMWPAGFPTFVLDGRSYGVTANVSTNAIWFNKDIFDAYGIPYPEGSWTWEEFIPLAQRLTVRDEKKRIKHFGLLCDWWNWRTFVYQYGGRVYTDDGTRCVVDSPEAVAGIQMMRDLIYKYNVMPSPVEEAGLAAQGGWGSGTITLFGGGKAAMAIGGRWWLCTLRDNVKEGKLRLGAVEGPHGPHHVFWSYGRGILLSKHSPRRKEALDFLRYAAGRGYNELINKQADALAPVIRYCYTDLYLNDPEYPEEDFNAVWRDTMHRARPEQISPFVNGQTASRILAKQLDLVKGDQKPVAGALRTAAREINEEIQKTLECDPTLKARYERLTGGKTR